MHDTRALASHLADLLRHEHAALGDFLVGLAAFDRERRWVELGYTSLFYFLHRELGLSKSAAFYRKTAAELIQQYPEIVEPLRQGTLCLSTVAELAKVITPENRHTVIELFLHASKAEARVVAAELRPAEAPPQRDVVTTVSTVPARTTADTTAPVDLGAAPTKAMAKPVLPANHSFGGDSATTAAHDAATTRSHSQPICGACTSPSPAASSTSSPLRATPSRTAIPAPPPRPSSKPRSTSSSPQIGRGRASW